jgi:hypothetical protein
LTDNRSDNDPKTEVKEVNAVPDSQPMNKVEALERLIGESIFNPKPLLPKLNPIEISQSGKQLTAVEKLKVMLQQRIDENPAPETEQTGEENLPGVTVIKKKFPSSLMMRPNRTACITHQCRKMTVLSCHRCLINTGVEKMNYI